MEPVLKDNLDKYTVFPIEHNEIWKLYKEGLGNFWTVEEIDFSKDIQDWETKLSENDKYFIKNVLAFFAGSDGIVNENLMLNFYKEVQLSEMRQFYATQIQIEAIHSECVAPETKILTKDGYFPISSLENKKVSLWNGYDWSHDVQIRKTGTNRKLYKVIMTDGSELHCTENHKWHIYKNDKETVIETKDLVKGDLPVGWEFPRLNTEDPDKFFHPYSHGFLSSDLGYGTSIEVSKLELQDGFYNRLVFAKETDKNNGNIEIDFKGYINKTRCYVPINYSFHTKMKWLEGLIDAESNFFENNIQIPHQSIEFLRDVKLLLTTIGLTSYIRKSPTRGYYLVVIDTTELFDLGLNCNVIKIPSSEYIIIPRPVIQSVEFEGRIDDTYCFTEPKNHTGIFNGIMTGQCYSQMIETYVSDEEEKKHLFRAIQTVPSIKKKADWALKWITNGEFAERLLAFIIIEGIFFSGSFCAIFWLKNRGLMPGLTLSNEFISRDEALHCRGGIALYKLLENKLSEEKVHMIFKEAVEIEKEFVTKSVPVNLIGMNSLLMCEYIEYIADFWLIALGYTSIYNAKNPFDFMQYISLESFGNFFETRISSYRRANVGVEREQTQFTMDEDF